jgi:hypothetical protein
MMTWPAVYKKSLLKGSNIYVREDFSDKIQEKRRELMRQMYEARQNNMIAILHYDKLITRPQDEDHLQHSEG